MNNVITTTTTVVDNTHQYADDVNRYSELIHTYGASTVIIAVFIVILLAIFAYLLRNNQKTSNQLMKQQQMLMDSLITIQEESDKKEDENIKCSTIVKEPDLVQIFLDINSNIKEILKDISDNINSSRAAVYVFHNGVYSSHGLPFFKTSCICEVIKKNCGVSKSIDLHSGLPLQMFDNNISYIYKNGKMTILDVNNEEDDLVHDAPVLVGMLKNNNIKSATGIAVYDHDNNILGILLVEFVEVQDSEFLHKAEEMLIEKASSLSPILEYSRIYNTTTK